MLLTIGKIPEGHSVLSQKVEVEEDRAEWIPLIGSLECRGEIDRIPTRIAVHVFYQGRMELECSRCLKKFEYPIQGECYVILKESSANNHETLGEESEFFFNDTTDEVDIRSAVFDEILLSLPLKPLCVESCPGIPLPMSTGFENQDKKSIDPRWENLKKLM